MPSGVAHCFGGCGTETPRPQIGSFSSVVEVVERVKQVIKQKLLRGVTGSIALPSLLSSRRMIR